MTTTGWYLELIGYLRAHTPDSYAHHMAANAIADLLHERDELVARLEAAAT